MAISDYIPNVFGQQGNMYEGLLSPQESAGLSQRSNIAGLLGTAAALAAGTSRQGPRRSALQNVLGALGAGYGASGQAYQGGIEQMANAQKLAQMKLQMQQNTATQQAINNLLQDPSIANDPAAVAYIRSNPADAIKQYAEITAFKRQREQYMPQAPSMAPADTTGQIQGQVLQEQGAEGKSEIYKLEQQKNKYLADASVYSDLRDPVKAKASMEMADKITERQSNLLANDIDIRGRIEKAPEAYKQQYKTIADLKKSRALKGKELLDAIQKVDQSVLESLKQYKFDGIAGNYAVTMFGTNDQTKLTPEQNRNILSYANAPTQADQTKIAIDAQKLKFETGAAPALPVSREAMLGGVSPVGAPSAVVTPTAQSVAAQPSAVAPRVQAKEAPAVVKPVVDIGKVTPLIQQPDNKVTPKRKQELIAAQPATIGLVNYTATQLVDARDAAQSLLNNPSELKAISGFTGPMMSIAPGTDAYTGAAKLENLQTRSFVSEIQKMRAASPTGGAVGSVTEKEMSALSNIQASLKAGLKEDVLRKQLKQYIDSANRALKTIPNEYARTYGYQGEFDEILKGGVVQQPQGSQLPKGVTVKKVQ
jgi:hypothetical protein